MLNLKENTHYLQLSESYESVGKKTWLNNDFLESDLLTSRNLFTKESLQSLKPKPKDLEVYALLSGISFNQETQNILISIQNEISKILDGALHYWVKPENLGVEYCVFKWPHESWNNSWLNIVKNEISLLDFSTFRFLIGGIQVNSDGCVIAKGYDHNRSILRIREHLKDRLEFLPKKQSNWAHIPIGRILEPLGYDKFSILRNSIERLSNENLAEFEITEVKLVHETRWYMEKKSILLKHQLK
jgi:hypothetical protein